MKRIIKASYDRPDTLNFVIDEGARERYIHTLIGELDSILYNKGISATIYSMGYTLMVDIIGSSNRDIIDTVIIPYSDIIYDWDDVYFAADKIAETVIAEARI